MKLQRTVLLFGIAGVLALVLGCGDDFRAQSDLDGLEVLGIQASPPAIAFGESSSLSALVYTDGEAATYVWSVCLFDTGAFTGFSCADASLECCLGTESQVTLSPDVLLNCNQDCLDLPDTDTEAEEKPFTVPELSSEEGKEALAMLEFVRVRVKVTSGGSSIEAVKRVDFYADGVKNTNPVIHEVTYEGDACEGEDVCTWGEDEVLSLDPGVTLKVIGDVSPGENEEEDAQTETSTIAWFTSGASMNQLFSRGGKPENQLKIPKEEDIEDETVTLYLVARDGEGGTSWTTRTALINAQSGEGESE